MTMTMTPTPTPTPTPTNIQLCRISTRDERFATIALDEANKSNMVHHKHGCVAVIGGRIIEKGYNSERCQSNDGFLENACSCHAEVDVMRKLEKRLSKKNSSFAGRQARSCFLRTSQPLRRKKKQEWREV